MNNITMNMQEKPQQSSQQSSDNTSQKMPNLVEIPIKDENTALNVMVSFLHLAQKRGAFNFEESTKAWECIKMFMKK
jgi:hypothetical protein